MINNKSLTTLKKVLKRPYYLDITIAGAIRSRFMRAKIIEEKRKATLWCEKFEESYQNLLLELDCELWTESKEYHYFLEQYAKKKLDNLGVKLGGGGDYRFLYFLIRKLKPNVVVETGVAAGFSSRAILDAITKNNKGTLYSSDLPYLRLDDAEKYVGVLVENNLKSNWQLFLGKDKDNFKKIIKMIDNIDLFHYDSDKSYRGRERAFTIASLFFTSDTIIIMDDIQDNLFFRDYVTKNKVPFKVFKFENKYIGVIGIDNLIDKYSI